MSIVAISPTLGSLGDEIGREVARARGYEFADREIIEKASARFGEGVMELAHATEEKPTLWERFVDTSRRYMTYVEAIVLEMAARDNVVLAGRGAAFLLGTTRHVLRVRVTAPERVRATRIVRAARPRPRGGGGTGSPERQRARRARSVPLPRGLERSAPLRPRHQHRPDDDPRGGRPHRPGASEPALPLDRGRTMTEIRDLNLVTQCRAALLARLRDPPAGSPGDVRSAPDHAERAGRVRRAAAARGGRHRRDPGGRRGQQRHRGAPEDRESGLDRKPLDRDSAARARGASILVGSPRPRTSLATTRSP